MTNYEIPQHVSILWDNFLKSPSINYRNKLVESYIPFARFIANKFKTTATPSIDLFDLYQYAYIGLIDSIEKYNPNKKTKFTTYASIRIRGAIIDGLRKEDTVSRSSRSKIKKYEYLLENLYPGNSTTDIIDLIHSLGLSQFESQLLINSSEAIIDIDSLKDFPLYSCMFDPLKSTILLDMSCIVEELLSKLTLREQFVLRMSYYYDMSNDEIALLLKTDLGRVSCIKYIALNKLKKWVSKEDKVYLECAAS